MSEYIIVSGKMRPDLYQSQVAPGSQPARKALITYEGLPSGGHSLGTRGAAEAWSQLSRFVSECTLPVHQGQGLSVYVAGRKPTKSEREVLDSASSRFGRSKLRRCPIRGMREHFWVLGPDQIEEGADWLVAHRSLPPIEVEPGFALPTLEVGVSVLFRLLDPRTGETLPFQGTEHYGSQDFDGYGAHGLGESRLNLRLTNHKSRCYICLSFPFEEMTDQLRQYVGECRQRLPFKLSAEHWRRWQLNAAGTAYYKRNLPAPWL